MYEKIKLADVITGLGRPKLLLFVGNGESEREGQRGSGEQDRADIGFIDFFRDCFIFLQGCHRPNQDGRFRPVITEWEKVVYPWKRDFSSDVLVRWFPIHSCEICSLSARA